MTPEGMLVALGGFGWHWGPLPRVPVPCNTAAVSLEVPTPRPRAGWVHGHGRGGGEPTQGTPRVAAPRWDLHPAPTAGIIRALPTHSFTSKAAP